MPRLRGAQVRFVRPEQIDESELKLDPNNARSHEKGIPELTRSLEAFGQVKPLVVWGDNVVIAGNGTLTAARQMGKTKLWIVRVPEDWDYNKARAFALADNATGDLSTWSLPQLDSTRWELDAEGWDVPGFGFEPLRPPPTPLLAAPDDVPPLPAIPTTKLGDLIILGRHRLVCGDATTNKAYDRVLEDEFVDAVWTDPPYNVGYVGGTDDHLTIAGDRQSDAAFRAFLTAAFHEMWNHAKPGAAIYVCHSDTGARTTTGSTNRSSTAGSPARRTPGTDQGTRRRCSTTTSGTAAKAAPRKNCSRCSRRSERRRRSCARTSPSDRRSTRP